MGGRRPDASSSRPHVFLVRHPVTIGAATAHNRRIESANVEAETAFLDRTRRIEIPVPGSVLPWTSHRKQCGVLRLQARVRFLLTAADWLSSMGQFSG